MIILRFYQIFLKRIGLKIIFLSNLIKDKLLRCLCWNTYNTYLFCYCQMNTTRLCINACTLGLHTCNAFAKFCCNIQYIDCFCPYACVCSDLLLAMQSWSFLETVTSHIQVLSLSFGGVQAPWYSLAGSYEILSASASYLCTVCGCESTVFEKEICTAERPVIQSQDNNNGH